MDGWNGSVSLASGEMVWNTCDVAFPSRGADVVFARTYRSHLSGESILGSGWFCACESALDPAVDWGLRYFDPMGRIHNLLNNAAGLYT